MNLTVIFRRVTKQLKVLRTQSTPQRSFKPSQLTCDRVCYPIWTSHWWPCYQKSWLLRHRVWEGTQKKGSGDTCK